MHASQELSGRSALALSLVVAAVSCFFLFVHLGHYDLWGDEADTALFAQGILATGDTTAVLGHNVYAYRNGALLTNLKNRYSPPLPYYLAAASMALGGANAWAVRLPFALAGLLTVALLLAWLWRARADRLMWLLMSLGIVGNASFFLYARQGRYYALATLLTVAVGYLYVHWKGANRTLAAIGLLLFALLATQYLSYIGLCAALAADYLLWQRHDRPLSRQQGLLILIPQIVAMAAMVAIWNPLGSSGVPDTPERNPLLDKLLLFLWTLRDLNACEFGVGLLMLLAPVLAIRGGHRRLGRASAALLIYCFVITMASPQPVAFTSVADVRYISAAIPLCIYLTAGVLHAGLGKVPALALAVALVAFGSNVLHLPWSPDRWQSSSWLLAREIVDRRTTSLMALSDWIDQHVEPGQSILVLPNHQAYPLMFHSPQAIYAWQLDSGGEPQFRDLPSIHTFGKELVDWIAVLGPAEPAVGTLNQAIAELGIEYRHVETLPYFADEGIRPELFWHSFRDRPVQDPAAEAVHLFRKANKPTAEPPNQESGAAATSDDRTQ